MSPPVASKRAAQRYLVRTINQFSNLDQMRDLLIKVDDGVPIRLKDVRNVVSQGYKEREGIVRVDGHEAIELAIYKEGDANTVSVAANVRRQIDHLTCKSGGPSCISIMPANAQLKTIDDQSVFIQQRARRREVRRAARRRTRDPDHLLLPRRLVEHVRHLALAAGLADRDVLLHGPVRRQPQRHVAWRAGAGHRHGRRRLDRRAREHRAHARTRRDDPRSRRKGRQGSLDGGHRVDADDGCRVLPAGVRAGCRRPAVPRSGAHRDVRDADLADRGDDADSDAGVAEGALAAGLQGRAGRPRAGLAQGLDRGRDVRAVAVADRRCEGNAQPRLRAAAAGKAAPAAVVRDIPAALVRLAADLPFRRSAGRGHRRSVRQGRGQGSARGEPVRDRAVRCCGAGLSPFAAEGVAASVAGARLRGTGLRDQRCADPDTRHGPDSAARAGALRDDRHDAAGHAAAGHRQRWCASCSARITTIRISP